MPHETAAFSAQVLWTPYNHAPSHFMQSHIRKVYACLAVTCHLHFWQNDWDLLRATAVTRGWNGYQNKSQHKKLTLEEKIIHRSCRDSNPGPFNHGSDALTTELSPLPHCTFALSCCWFIYRSSVIANTVVNHVPFYSTLRTSGVFSERRQGTRDSP